MAMDLRFGPATLRIWRKEEPPPGWEADAATTGASEGGADGAERIVL